MDAISIKFEKGFLKYLEAVMRKYRYATKTEFIREAVRDKVRDLEKEEALVRLRKLYGAAKTKTSDKEYALARVMAFDELEKELK